jgi:hypothetical protein
MFPIAIGIAVSAVFTAEHETGAKNKNLPAGRRGIYIQFR